MRIVNLIENTPGVADCLYEHGLSFYIETKEHKILADAGKSDNFLHNADVLGIDLKKVNLAFLSHGHYDHSGGLMSFARLNPAARIYMQKSAGDNYYHVDPNRVEYIGIDQELLNLEQICLLDGAVELDEEISIFTDVKGRRLWPKGNLNLKKRIGADDLQDEFEHEQYLVLSQDGKKILISGCAHNGILNILEKYREIYGSDPDVVISGFHMMKHNGYTEEDEAIIREIAEELVKTKIKLYTGHCTAEHPFELMKEVLGDQLVWVHSGEEISFV